MNAQDLNLYGLEVSYFKGPAECFVPRLAIQPPSPQQRAATAPTIDVYLVVDGIANLACTIQQFTRSCVSGSTTIVVPASSTLSIQIHTWSGIPGLLGFDLLFGWRATS